jgi:HKD family nuclease
MAVDGWDLIPGSRLRNPAQAIGELWEPSDSVTAAVAFVTSGGIHDLIGLVGTDLSRLELTVRAAPISEPRALLELEAAGARVYGIAGTRARRFHPKLWLGHTGDRLMVLSGSANLTTPALTQNQEQMEPFSFSAGSDAAAAHLHRFSQLIVDRLSLEELTDTPYWERWEVLQTRLANEQRDLADELSKPLGLPDPRHRALREALLRNLQETKDSLIPLESGGPWVPQRTINMVNKADDAELVPMLARIIKETKTGFSLLVNHGRDDLLFERLVLDESLPFHSLFSEDMKQAARERLNEFGLE